MSRRWIVQTPGPLVLSRILDRMEDPDALAQGRVFIDRHRASADLTLPPGAVVEVYPPRPPGEEPRVLDQRHGVLALFKPAALPTIADHRGARSLLQWACELLGRQDLHTTSRLDVGVSGVVLVATDQEARARLALAREQGAYRRTYLALVPAAPLAPTSGTWSWAIGKGKGNLRTALPPGTPGAPDATTHFSTLASADRADLLRVEPVTGRTHQIRVHCARAGRPILGDGPYGGSMRMVAPNGSVHRATRIGLHAFRVEVQDQGGAPWRVEAPVPDDYLALWRAAGGATLPEAP
ncbi:MAG: pseudouridine synthase [Polyangiaceae bacterium]|jgi:23S rRNA-/tRNA-specific pseudouridylate synthase|nr:pseudouridine synthase [Polyangiaceae bacterium]